MRVCSGCDSFKQVEEFYLLKSGRRRGQRIRQCKACCSARSRDRYRNNVEVRERAAERYVANREAVLEYSKVYYATLRETAIEVYGGRCVECGSTEDLQFDHVHGGGQAHRRTESHQSYMRRIARAGQRLDDVDLQLLCVPHHRAKTAEQAAARSAA